MKTPGWDDWFMTMVYLIATKSKDQSTHVGAVVVGPDNEVRSIGYNSFPRGIDDNQPERQKRPEKYFWFEHAERNCVFNAALIGTPLKGCRIYLNGLPCMDCARAIVQSGIVEVITDKTWDQSDKREEWAESFKKTLELFKEAGVTVREWEGELIPIVKFRRGEII